MYRIKNLDMHVHTGASRDSDMKKDAIVKYLKKRQDFAMVILDHNEIDGALELKKELPDQIIVGEEIKTNEGEVAGLFLKEKIPKGKSIHWTMDAILVQGGLIYIPHPLDRLRTSRLTKEGLEAALKRADILEVFNARNVFAADDRQAQVLAGERGLLSGCGSDAHTHLELGNAYMSFQDPVELTRDGLIEGLENATPVARRSFIGVHFVTKYKKWKVRKKR